MTQVLGKFSVVYFLQLRMRFFLTVRHYMRFHSQFFSFQEHVYTKAKSTIRMTDGKMAAS